MTKQTPGDRVKGFHAAMDYLANPSEPDARLVAAEALDRAYAEAEAFDAARMIETWRAEDARLAALDVEAEEVWTLDDWNKIAGDRR